MCLAFMDFSCLENDPDFAAARNYSAKEMAAHFKIHRRRLLREFQERLHLTPEQWLEAERDRRAVNLLRGSRLSIKEISQLLKYSQSSAFGRAFKREHGVWPRAFRRLQRKVETARSARAESPPRDHCHLGHGQGGGAFSEPQRGSIP